MAESIVVDLLLGVIVPLVEKETALLRGVSDELRELKQQLVCMKSFLEDADKTATDSQVMKNWVADVRDRCYEAEDIIDEFMYHVNAEHFRGKLTSFFLKITYFPKNLWVRHHIGTKLQKLNRIIKSIPGRNEPYLVGTAEGTSSDHRQEWVQNMRESALFLSDSDLVGIEDEKKTLLGWLMDEQPQRIVVSVVGMGGSGKTTLVGKVYNSPAAKRYFQTYAWITVSQTYAARDLFRRMTKEFYQATKEAAPIDLDTATYKELVETLVSYLQLKRYLIVLDDVWSSNLWGEVSVSLPDGMLGSRVVVTTRNQDIASFSYGIGSKFCQVKPLEMREAWTLFCMKAFAGIPDKTCPSHLESLAHDLIKKCEGLPLAIVALGGLMSTKSSESEWRKVSENLNRELDKNPILQMVKSVLFLSFIDLPYRLKTCFLYCSAFPEDYSIGRNRLIRLWMAEGLVEYIRRTRPEEVAESYLMELICRGMLQVVKRNGSGRPQFVRMHDLLRELALSTSEAENFLNIYDGQEACTKVVVSRRLSVQAGNWDMQSSKHESNLRALFIFVGKMVTTFSLGELKNLQVLSAVEAEGEFIRKVRGMSQLTKLGITKVREVDEDDLCGAIQSMSLLQTLDVITAGEDECLRMDKLSSVPRLLNKLFLGGKLEKMPHWLPSLRSLTSLSLHWSRLGENPIPYIQNLPNLGHLILNDTCNGPVLCFSTGFPKLLKLYIVNFLDLKEIIIEKGVMPGLRDIVLYSCNELKGLPHGIENLSNLQELNLGLLPDNIAESIREQGSINRHKVQHIPIINHFYQTSSGEFLNERL